MDEHEDAQVVSLFYSKDHFRMNGLTTFQLLLITTQFNLTTNALKEFNKFIALLDGDLISTERESLHNSLKHSTALEESIQLNDGNDAKIQLRSKLVIVVTSHQYPSMKEEIYEKRNSPRQTADDSTETIPTTSG